MTEDVERLRKRRTKKQKEKGRKEYTSPYNKILSPSLIRHSYSTDIQYSIFAFSSSSSFKRGTNKPHTTLACDLDSYVIHTNLLVSVQLFPEVLGKRTVWFPCACLRSKFKFTSS